MINESTLIAMVLPFIPANMPEAKRIERLRPHFEPAIGEYLEIDKTSLSKKKLSQHPERVRGYIKVKPPKGVCFLITKHESIPDVTVCKPTVLSFHIEDLEADGSLTWIIKAGNKDFGTPIKWKTTVRPGKIIDLNAPWPGPAKTIFLQKCIAQHTASKGRALYLYAVTGERWVITLPAKDRYASSLSKRPNLYRPSAIKKKGGVKKRKDRSKISALLVYSTDEKKYRRKEWVPTWQTHPRGAFSISANNFASNGSVTPGLKGKCRYKYSGYKSDFSSGSLECHDVQNYKWLYVPLTCIQDLKIDR